MKIWFDNLCILFLRTHKKFGIKKSLKMTMGPDALAVVRPTGVYLLEFFCSGIQFYVLLSPFLCFIPF